jgi:hypothetical protein
VISHRLLESALPRSLLLRTALAVSKWPITPIRAQRTPIKRINKPKEPTGTLPVTQCTPPITTSDTSQTVTRRLMEVIGCTPVRNEA